MNGVEDSSFSGVNEKMSLYFNAKSIYKIIPDDVTGISACYNY